MRARAHARLQAVAEAGARRTRRFERPKGTDGVPMKVSEFFGCNTFSFDLMEKSLAAEDVAVLKEFATSGQILTEALANKVARAVQEWAISRGATHYCHWFQPQTGATAEKHDAFFSLDASGGAIEKFTGKQLIQAEPDASSFPSGGVRATFEARGYTAWDASSPIFLMETDNGMTLCIPSVFISYGGQALDKKTPLLRSIKAVSDKAVEALMLLGHNNAKYVTATAGPEQEYFVVDEALYALRPDMQLAGRTLMGRTPPRHQQLEDHYFGSIKPRVLNFIMECEQELYKLGVPCKTRHNEVAPAQCEAAPIFEFANVAADHNQLVMEVIKSVARRHGLVALFHEKPYADVNGSGKHLNWSMADNEGHNLLEPGDAPHENVRFLYFLTAVTKAIHDNGSLLRMAVATPGNDFRLGANEAPPAIMSVFLGETLDAVLNRICEGGGAPAEHAREINLDLAKVPVIARDNTDRNRTSPFAFTGNKFEFRALGSSMSISMPLTCLNAAVAEALDDMNQRLAKKSNGGQATDEQVLEIVKEVGIETKKIRFEGDNYSEEWHAEAQKRGLPNLKTTPEALKVMQASQVQAMFDKHKILTKEESESRYNVRLERYNKTRMIELETLLELVATHVLPAAVAHQSQLAKSIDEVKDILKKSPVTQTKALEGVTQLTEKLYEHYQTLQMFIGECAAQTDDAKLGDLLALKGMQHMENIQKICNNLELVVDDDLWSLPKYREMLYLI